MDDSELLERVNGLLAQSRTGIATDQDVELLVLLLHRTAVELNKSARANTNSANGTPDWGAWAGDMALAEYDARAGSAGEYVSGHRAEAEGRRRLACRQA